MRNEIKNNKKLFHFTLTQNEIMLEEHCCLRLRNQYWIMSVGLNLNFDVVPGVFP